MNFNSLCSELFFVNGSVRSSAMHGSKDERSASNNFIFKLEPHCSTDLSLITPHIKALIKGSVSRLLWLEEIFQESASKYLSVAGLAVCGGLAAPGFARISLGPQQSLASITSITVVTKLRLCRNPPGGFLGLQRRPLQLVDRPGVHDVRHLQGEDQDDE